MSTCNAETTTRRCLMRSVAQVMLRQEVGWMPMGLGGLSQVIIVERKQPNSTDYLIEAYQNDECLGGKLLEYVMDASIKYNKINPTFHSWSSNLTNHKYGLTFDNIEAADKFQHVIAQIIRKFNQRAGSTKSADCRVQDRAWSGSCRQIPLNMACFQTPQMFNEQIVAFEMPPRRHFRSASASSAPCLSRILTGPAIVSVGGPPSSYDECGPTDNEYLQVPMSPSSSPLQSGHCCFSRTRTHTDFHHHDTMNTPSSSTTIPVASLALPPSLLTCVYCRRIYRPRHNPPGSCELAPDTTRTILDYLTLQPLAARLYALLAACFCLDSHHTTSGANSASTPQERYSGDFSRSDLSLNCHHKWHRSCVLRAIVYCVLPCVCCHGACVATYNRAVDRGWVGGRHSTLRQISTASRQYKMGTGGIGSGLNNNSHNNINNRRSPSLASSSNINLIQHHPSTVR